MKSKRNIKKNNKKYKKSTKKNQHGIRFRRKSLKRSKMGGMNTSYKTNPSLNQITRWTIIDDDTWDQFKTYIYGSMYHAHAWGKVFEICKEKKIKVYVVTNSGDPPGVIRTLQLLELLGDDPYIEDVLFMRSDRKDDSVDKSVVINQIMSDNPESKGVFFDDYSENFRGVVSKVYCQLVTHTNMNVKAEGFAMNPNNVFINLLPRHKSLIRLRYTLISLNLLASLIYALNDELLNFLDFSIDKHQLTINKMRGCTHLFVDFDCTLSLWESVIPESDFKTRLRDVYKDASEVVEAPPLEAEEAAAEEAPAPLEEAQAPVEEAPATVEEAPAPAPVENVAQEPVAPASLENVAPASLENVAPASLENVAPASLENVAQVPVVPASLENVAPQTNP
jgi:hypothetical protein